VGWVEPVSSQLMGWVGSGHTKWTHGLWWHATLVLNVSMWYAVNSQLRFNWLVSVSTTVLVNAYLHKYVANVNSIYST